MFLFALFITLLFGGAQDPPVAWTISSAANEDGHLQVVLTAAIADGWHVYATSLPREDGPIPTVFRFERSDRYELVGDVSGPEPQEEYDPNFAMVVRHHSNSARFVQSIRATTQDTFSVAGEVEYMVCNDHTCLPPVAVPFGVQFNEHAPKP